jgi:hypothetical protein
MAGRWVGKIGDLPLHPELLEVFLKHPAEKSGQTTDSEDRFFREDVQRECSFVRF